ncbi:hypothetical protein N866_19175 [Actinotalea ferrariae CF5-4]|uniref:Uncharacterized protein n=1 Tax=Actinotalea ferrariae CF5-4 TaxID=948458 RepID=A0A021VX51_9CELL|nr:hypothetical protein [Actinotalea ferrariae]EYR63657.1 hypothetical protein N866_19175 [Actinotalea ferrariae CF5-4]
MIRIDDIEAGTCWSAPDAPDLGEPDLPTCDPHGLLADGPHPFALDAPESRNFYATVDGYTRCVVGEEPARADLELLAPEGAVVAELRTCAVVLGEQVLRVWPHRWSTDHRLVVPAADGAAAFEVGGGAPVKWAVERALALSQRLGVPVLVARRHVLLPHGAWPAPVLPDGPAQVDDTTAWQADDAPPFDPPPLRDCCHPAAPELGPPLLSTAHDDVARFYATNHGHTAALLEDAVPAFDPYRRIPMGYTTLRLQEKRAIVHAGRVLRIWPLAHERPSAEERDESYRLTVGPGEQGEWIRDLTGEPTLATALRAALVLSARAGVTVLVSRDLEERDWH